MEALGRGKVVLSAVCRFKVVIVVRALLGRGGEGEGGEVGRRGASHDVLREIVLARAFKKGEGKVTNVAVQIEPPPALIIELTYAAPRGALHVQVTAPNQSSYVHNADKSYAY